MRAKRKHTWLDFDKLSRVAGRQVRMSDIETDYWHKEGRIVISRGIGKNGFFAMIRKANGSLRRFVPIKQAASADGISEQLDNYRGKAIWRKLRGWI